MFWDNSNSDFNRDIVNKYDADWIMIIWEEITKGIVTFTYRQIIHVIVVIVR